MQPTYLPWIGYFDLIDRVDLFVFLDTVQFSKQSWHQRNRVKGHQGPMWQSVPILSKGRFGQAILDVEIDQTKGFSQKQIKTISQYYGNAPYFSDYVAGLSEVIERSHSRLVDLNIEIIDWFCRELGIETEKILNSALDSGGRKVELVIDICKTLGADRYISPEGSRTYIEEDNQFKANGIELEYHGFHHPDYRQLHGEFVSHLSALDLLLNEGPASLEIIRSGREDATASRKGH